MRRFTSITIAGRSAKYRLVVSLDLVSHHFHMNYFSTRIYKSLQEWVYCTVSVVDLREKVENNADYEISADDLQQWELQHAARLEPLVILWTGWGSRWANKENYLGTSINDPSSLHFPGILMVRDGELIKPYV